MAFARYDPGPGRRRVCDPSVLVRAGVVEDVPGCLDLVEGVLGLDRVSWAAGLTASVSDEQRMLHVAEDAGRIVGYARTSFWTPPLDAPSNAAPAGWYLLGLVVAPGHRRSGIGEALTVARMEAVATRADAVWYFANARNRASLDLHARLGFVEVTRDFWFPDVTFEGGEGVLCRVALRSEAAPRAADGGRGSAGA